MGNQAQAAESKLTARLAGTEHARRLSETKHAILPILQSWWNAHPGDPYAKLVGVTQLLQDLEHEMSPLPRTSVMPMQPSQASEDESPFRGANTLQSWAEQYGLSHSFQVKLQAEAINTVAELAI